MRMMKWFKKKEVVPVITCIVVNRDHWVDSLFLDMYYPDVIYSYMVINQDDARVYETVFEKMKKHVDFFSDLGFYHDMPQSKKIK